MLRLADGVSLRGMRAEAHVALVIAHQVWERRFPGVDCWITSVTNGTHADRSYHHNGLAFDLRAHQLAPGDGAAYAAELRAVLGTSPRTYQVVYENDGTTNAHIHVEHDDGKERPMTAQEAVQQEAWREDERQDAEMWLRWRKEEEEHNAQ